MDAYREAVVALLSGEYRIREHCIGGKAVKAQLQRPRPEVEEIVRHTSERYIDNETHRLIAIGKHKGAIVLVPYEESETSLTPITVHVTSHRQMNFRIKTGRYSHE